MKNFNLGGKWKVEGGRNPPASRLPPSTARSASFTLIEMIGVMAVMGILAAIVVPPLIQQLENAQRVDEDANLEEIARALLEGIEREKKFPNPTVAATSSDGWVGIGSKYSVLGTNKFWKTFPGRTNDTARRVYLDQSLISYLSGNYTMPASGWTNTSLPSSALIYIVSASRPDFLLGCPTNANLAQANLDWLKNWVKTYEGGGRISATNTAIVGNIAGSTALWTNRGDFLHVKILNTSSLLCEVYLEDWHSPITNVVLQSPATAPTPTNTMNPFSSNNFTLGFSGSSWLLQAQPERNLSSGFTTSTSGGKKNAMDINYINTNGNTRTIRLTLPDSPKFSLNNSVPTDITDLTANPNTRKDSTNFYALKNSVLVLYDNAATPSVQSTIQIKNKRHFHVFSSGVWSQKD